MVWSAADPTGFFRHLAIRGQDDYELCQLYLPLWFGDSRFCSNWNHPLPVSRNLRHVSLRGGLP
jgi:hypothetical protein